MSSESIRPSTLDGIKRLAKSLKVERGIQHVRALDEAAQAAGFQSYRHATHTLPTTAPKAERPRLGYCTFLTAYWKDREGRGSGRETLAIWLTAPWAELITPAELKNHRSLVHFRAKGLDHLAREHLMSTQSGARRMVCEAARVLHFMDATKLRPSKGYSRAFPGGRSSNAIPGRDHQSIWFDQKTRRYLFADEPYEKAVESKAQEREDWALRHGFIIVKPLWAGMYAPDIGSRLYLVADETKGIPLQPIAAALDGLPAPIVESTWEGESAPTLPHFVSPGTVATVATEKGRIKTPRNSNVQRSSVEYQRVFVGPQRRPKGQMPIEAHAEVGRLLKSVLEATYHRKGVYNRIDAVRSELDEWVQREYSHKELSNERFFSLYYQQSNGELSQSLPEIEPRGRHTENLTEARKLMTQHYPDCQPLRSLLKKMDAAVKSLQDWG